MAGQQSGRSRPACGPAESLAEPGSCPRPGPAQHSAGAIGAIKESIAGPACGSRTLPAARTPASTPASEADRLRALTELDVPESRPESEFDALAPTAALVCGWPIAVISPIDVDRQWFKACAGRSGVGRTRRELAFFAPAIPVVIPFAISALPTKSNSPVVRSFKLYAPPAGAGPGSRLPAVLWNTA
jgi:hypothetical protein